MNYKKYLFPLLLTCLFGILILLSAPGGAFYGSYTDWLSQHVRLGETIRSACIEQNTLVPAFLPLGGGSNGYQFSYYGYLRPDILFGCFFPSLPMVYIMIGYSLAGYLCAILLCYCWLYEHTKDRFLSFLGGVFFLTAACFFHTHRQMMFVNYMPFLILALLCVRKKWFRGLPFCLLLIYLNSFYYSIACLVVVGWYWLRQEGTYFWKQGFWQYIKSVCLSIGMAAILLIPTAAVILEHKRTGPSQGVTDILENSLNPNAMLYSPYGMGLTAIALYMLIRGLFVRKFRADCILLLSVSFCGLAPWLLNGTLYARSKILIPFIPLIILVCTDMLAELKARRVTWSLWPCLFLVPVLAFRSTHQNFYWIVADAAVLLLVIILQKLDYFGVGRGPGYYITHGLLCLIPCFLFYQTSQKEEYVNKKDVFSAESAISVSDLTNTPSLYRYDNLMGPLNSGNLSKDGEMQKSGMYSSIYNHAYSNFYYDTMMSPLQINNRLAILPAANPFLLNALGVRYIQTSPDSVPDGYHIIGTTKRSGSSIIPAGEKEIVAENDSVLPIAYVTDSAMNESQFRTLDSYDKLDAITRYTIVPDPKDAGSLSGAIEFQSHMKAFKPDFKASTVSESVQITKNTDGLHITAAKDSTLTLTLSKPVTDQILLLEFQVINERSRPIVIDINHIRNKLSGKNAAYPNGNSTFHYQFSEQGLQTLHVALPKGTYQLKNIKWHTYNKSLLTDKRYSSVQTRARGKQDLLCCTITSGVQDYFVTSIPYQKGIEIYMDGKSLPVLKVNQAFAGTLLPSGVHDINIRFSPPGRTVGFAITLICWMLCLSGFHPAFAHARSLQPAYQLHKKETKRLPQNTYSGKV